MLINLEEKIYHPIAASNNHLLIGNSSGSINIWENNEHRVNTIRHYFNRRNSGVKSIFNFDNLTYLVLFNNNSVGFWKHPTEYKLLIEGIEGIETITFKDNKTALFAERNLILQINTESKVKNFAQSDYNISSLVVHKGFLVCSLHIKRLELRHLTNGSIISFYDFKNQHFSIDRLVSSHIFLLSSSLMGIVCQWSIYANNLNLIGNFRPRNQSHPTCLLKLANNKLIVGMNDSTILLYIRDYYNYAPSPKILVGHKSAVLGFAQLKDETLYSSSSDGKVLAWSKELLAWY